MENHNTEDSVFQEIPTEKIYTEKQIRLGTFFCGPLVAGYCLAENFKAFGDKEKAKKTWLITILSSFLVILLIFSIPENINIPNIIFPIIYTGIASFIIKKYQEKDIKKHLENGGETFGGWRTVLIGLISLAAFCLVIIGAYILLDLAL
ncbi:hypothetical protein [Flavobacterium sp.]|uniref:hypothetical protein n=1 Tax=Flavobacterium sp. TaxID=239 RepID=UPI0031DC8AB1